VGPNSALALPPVSSESHGEGKGDGKLSQNSWSFRELGGKRTALSCAAVYVRACLPTAPLAWLGNPRLLVRLRQPCGLWPPNPTPLLLPLPLLLLPAPAPAPAPAAAPAPAPAPAPASAPCVAPPPRSAHGWAAPPRSSVLLSGASGWRGGPLLRPEGRAQA